MNRAAPGEAPPVLPRGAAQVSGERPRRLWVWLLPCAVVAALGVVVYLYPPGVAPIYPQCVFHSATGLSCPGCGTLRAMHQLLHGHVKAAFGLNPLLFVLLPLLLLGLVSEVFRWRGRELTVLTRLFRHAAWGWVVGGTVIAYGILRNLPFPPFTALAP